MEKTLLEQLQEHKMKQMMAPILDKIDDWVVKHYCGKDVKQTRNTNKRPRGTI